jgi:hypothetical protein
VPEGESVPGGETRLNRQRTVIGNATLYKWLEYLSFRSLSQKRSTPRQHGDCIIHDWSDEKVYSVTVAPNPSMMYPALIVAQHEGEMEHVEQRAWGQSHAPYAQTMCSSDLCT